jgi:hypothetical protein
MRRFLLKTSSVFTFIAAVLVLEGLVLGSLPLLPGVLLLPSLGVITLGLFNAGVYGRRHAHRGTRPSGTAKPPLYVVAGTRRPNGPKAA